ncbi:uncharacterized protein LAESUDRAFT_646411 [Laetiporus sulphureus 93-53]|uniref:Cupredoxin n=1 Tax=Laetiporus sulphureus 93-53 TaxID=1314785 RepID=A0A165G1U5_9APHY|nr:uncharacterized protein LAESUDRAFT_646411 [Laetiporus sulphureus 93-53]KZT09715.1 hypothetical protein LAESUDRAFT_646411 [Laetiporus sulphureus 93-53]
MRFATALIALLPVGFALGEVINIKVGENKTLTYTPSSVNASVGDTLTFEFVAGNHTVTQSTFASPCSNFTFTNGSTGVDSGFEFVATNATSFPTYSFTVTNASTPLWFYCRQTGHCEKGMVFAVNPTAEKTFAEFQAAAEKTTTNTTTSSSASVSGSSTASSTAASTSASTTSTNGAMRLGGTAAAVAFSGLGVLAGLLL